MISTGCIPLLAEEGRRDSLIEAGAPGWSVRPKRFAGLTTPSAPSLRSAHPPLLCEEGNKNDHITVLTCPRNSRAIYRSWVERHKQCTAGADSAPRNPDGTLRPDKTTRAAPVS